MRLEIGEFIEKRRATRRKSDMKDGRWQLAFWILTSICGIWLWALTQQMIVFYKENSSEHTVIIGDLREIKTRLGINDWKQMAKAGDETVYGTGSGSVGSR